MGPLPLLPHAGDHAIADVCVTKDGLLEVVKALRPVEQRLQDSFAALVGREVRQVRVADRDDIGRERPIAAARSPREYASQPRRITSTFSSDIGG